MRVKPEDIAAHLKRNLAPVYLVSGDEPLQLMEACDAIRARAREAGCHERLVFDAQRGFDWNTLTQSSDSLSLFAERRLLELRVSGDAGTGQEGSQALRDYAERPPEGDVLLISMGKIDKKEQGSKWFTALDSLGVVVQVWPMEAARLPAWIMERMSRKGMRPSKEAVALLADQVEGNLLACVQEIEKLHLLYGAGDVGVEAVVESVADSARYDVFDLADRALAGDPADVARALAGLRSEGETPVLVLWALVREIRSLSKMSLELRQGQSMDAILAKWRVWDKRKLLIKKGLERHALASWRAMLRRAGQIDRMIKGRAAGNVWDELLQLALFMAGVRYIAKGT
jgi:DNA polymerase-3 subunit delta